MQTTLLIVNFNDLVKTICATTRLAGLKDTAKRYPGIKGEKHTRMRTRLCSTRSSATPSSDLLRPSKAIRRTLSRYPSRTRRRPSR